SCSCSGRSPKSRKSRLTGIPAAFPPPADWAPPRHRIGRTFSSGTGCRPRPSLCSVRDESCRDILDRQAGEDIGGIDRKGQDLAWPVYVQRQHADEERGFIQANEPGIEPGFLQLPLEHVRGPAKGRAVDLQSGAQRPVHGDIELAVVYEVISALNGVRNLRHVVKRVCEKLSLALGAARIDQLQILTGLRIENIREARIAMSHD